MEFLIFALKMVFTTNTMLIHQRKFSAIPFLSPTLRRSTTFTETRCYFQRPCPTQPTLHWPSSKKWANYNPSSLKILTAYTKRQEVKKFLNSMAVSLEIPVLNVGKNMELKKFFTPSASQNVTVVVLLSLMSFSTKRAWMKIPSMMPSATSAMPKY